jgi:hypothetical protein
MEQKKIEQQKPSIIFLAELNKTGTENFTLLFEFYGEEGRSTCMTLNTNTKWRQGTLHGLEGSYGAPCTFRWQSFEGVKRFRVHPVVLVTIYIIR